MTNRPYVLLTALAACGGGSHFDDVAGNVEGIYMVNTYTRNEAACSEGGMSVLGMDTFAFATKVSFSGLSFLTIASCASVADCHLKVDEVHNGGGSGTD